MKNIKQTYGLLSRLTDLIKGERIDLSSETRKKLISGTGDKIESQNAVIEVIEFNGKKTIKKAFLPGAINSFQNEVQAFSVFKKYDWCPEVYASGENYIIMEYFPNEYRLDNIYINRRSLINDNLLKNILNCIIDIYCEGFAHKNLNAENIFITEKGIKIIDFESADRIPALTDFFDSYDIIGKGEEMDKDNVFVMSNNKMSLKTLFKIKSDEKLKILLSDILKEQMLSSSISFFTKKSGEDARHVLKRKNIYSTFELKYVKVSNEEGQRNTEKRFMQFKIDSGVINNKRILDIGSNIGGTLLGLAKYAPSYMLGIEYDADKVVLADRIARLNNVPNIEFKTVDVENESFLKHFDLKFDVVFCLAVVEHIQKKEELFKKLGEICTDKLYFEGNASTNIDFVINNLKAAGFKNVNYLGFSNDEKVQKSNNRPVFIATKI